MCGLAHAGNAGVTLTPPIRHYLCLLKFALPSDLQVGVGRFQWTALAVCGLANASDAVEILGLSLVLPAAEDDLKLTAAGKSALSSCIFMGEGG